MAFLAQPVLAHTVLEQRAQSLAQPLAQPLRQASQTPRLGLSGPTLGHLMAHMLMGSRLGLSRPMMGTRLGPA
jgi:hypothetical protein